MEKTTQANGEKVDEILWSSSIARIVCLDSKKYIAKSLPYYYNNKANRLGTSSHDEMRSVILGDRDIRAVILSLIFYGVYFILVYHCFIN